MASQKQIKRIAIVGLGLIGGSLAMTLKSSGYEIIGITKKNETLEKAKKLKLIDSGSTELNSDVLKNVDVIFLSPPLSYISYYIKEVSKIVKHEVILTDVGSTKLDICKTAKSVLPENIAFIGGHPMAGTEQSGFNSAQTNLFKNCAWVLTPIDSSEKSKKALSLLQNIIKQIGAKPVISNPEKHDQAVALISHLPLLASIGLCRVVKDIKDSKLKNLALLLASSGFRDMTRIGGGNPELNSDLLASNISQLINLLPKYYSELEKMLELAKDKTDELRKVLSVVNSWRGNLYNSEGKNNSLSKESNIH
ncbi:MAG: prephenate dehydrogenase/arogenate dehydrogenase family protein [Candidatus Melainabacteria bacterium]|nr:prephenate dehydrogenase/arogenate dehydrogenase family protein [Candidatus Melainabacteria bacterium]